MEGVFTEVSNCFFNNREGSFHILKGMGSLKRVIHSWKRSLPTFLIFLRGQWKKQKARVVSFNGWPYLVLWELNIDFFLQRTRTNPHFKITIEVDEYEYKSSLKKISKIGKLSVTRGVFEWVRLKVNLLYTNVRFFDRCVHSLVPIQKDVYIL